MTKNNYFIAICLFLATLPCFTYAGEAFLTWTPSPGPNLAGYTIYFDTVSHASGTCPNDYANFNSPIVVGSTTSYTATGLTEGQTYFFQITAFDSLNNQSSCSYDPGEQSITIASDNASIEPKINSSNGGGGGGENINTDTLSPDTGISVKTENTAQPLQNTDITEGLSQTTTSESSITAHSLTPENMIAKEASLIFKDSSYLPLSQENIHLYSKIVSLSETPSAEEEKQKIATFIQAGTPSTKILGAGERAGTIGSFFSAFGRLPKSEADWEDVVKISNGRWTSDRNPKAENTAESVFNKIYLRKPERSTNKYDDNAIIVITYGLRPSNRNIGSEANAIKSFKNIFNRMPNMPNEWDIVRAIAYSGAKR